MEKTATAITYMSRNRSKQMAGLVNKLSASQLFRSIPPNQIELLLHRLRPVVFNPLEIMFKEGSKGDSLYIIESGEINLTRGGELIGKLTSGDIVGEIALLTSSP